MVLGGFVLWCSISAAASGRAAVETWMNEVLRCLGGGELAGCDPWWSGTALVLHWSQALHHRGVHDSSSQTSVKASSALLAPTRSGASCLTNGSAR